MSKADVVTLGRGGLVINLLGLACVLMGVGFTVLISTSSSNTLGDVVTDDLLFGLIAAYGYLTSTTSVQIRGNDLVLVRLVATASVPLSSVERVDGENGLEVTTRDGHVLTHIGYGSSIIGAFTGNRRANRVAERIRQWLPSEPAKAAIERDAVVRRVRPGLVFVLLFPLVLGAFGAAIH